MAVHKLNPGYRARVLSTTQDESGVGWLIEKDSSYVEIVITFDAEAAPFPAFGGKDCRRITFQKG